MKICIATTQGGLDDQVCPVFGRCPTFTFVDVEEKEIKNVEVIPNEFAGAAGGAGIQAAQLVVNKGVQAVIAGNYGPNAHPILSQGGADAISVQGIGVKDAVTKYVDGELKPTDQPTVAKFGGMTGDSTGLGGGMGRGGGMGMGRGGGKGMGRGGGRGMGLGKGMWGTPTQSPSSVMPAQTKEQELQVLDDQTKQLEAQLSEIKRRIDELKK